MSEKEKMLAGKIYDPTDEELTILRTKAHRLSQHYNTLFEDDDLRNTIIDELIPSKGEGLYLQGPIYFDYGIFTSFGKNCYANFNFTVLDVCPVNIGSNVFFGPNCSLMTPMHPLRWQERNIKFKDDKTAYDDEYAKPINIGEGCVIGAGSVVTKDIPANSLAAGNPCKVIREINEKDSIKYKKELF